MKRRAFLSRIAQAATAFVVAPGAFRALPSAQNVRRAVAAPAKVVPFWYQTKRAGRYTSLAYEAGIRSQLTSAYVSAPIEGIWFGVNHPHDEAGILQDQPVKRIIESGSMTRAEIAYLNREQLREIYSTIFSDLPLT